MKRSTSLSVRPSLEALEDRTVPTLLAAAFPGQGVWAYNGGGWRQLTAANASLVAADPYGDVVAEIPGQGVWLFQNNFTWRQITANNAAGLGLGYSTVSYHWSAGTETLTYFYVAAQFPGQGLWRWTSFGDSNIPPHGGSYVNEYWKQLTANNAATEAVAPNGSVAAEFQGQGLWLFTDAGGWRQLTPSDATSVAIGSVLNGPTRVVAEFPGYGVWRFQDNAGWQQLTAANAVSVGVNAGGDVVGDFGGAGVWKYTNAATGTAADGWHQLVAEAAELVCIDADGSVYGQFHGAGLWYDFGGAPNSWLQITANNASALGAGV